MKYFREKLSISYKFRTKRCIRKGNTTIRVSNWKGSGQHTVEITLNRFKKDFHKIYFLEGLPHNRKYIFNEKTFQF